MTPRRIVAVAGVVAGTLAVIYGIAWYVIADRLRGGIDRWVAERRAEGWTARHGDISIGGFPLEWRAHILSPRLAQSVRKPFFLWSGPSFDIAWRPWKTHVVDFRTDGTHRLGVGTTEESGTVPVTMAEAHGTLTFGPRGRLDNLILQIDDASLPDRSGEILHVAGLSGALGTGPVPGSIPPAEPHLKPAFRFDVGLSGVTLPAEIRPVLGRKIEKIGLRGAVLGELPAGTVRQAVTAWRDSGGTVEVKRAELVWSALRIVGNGTMALDAALQPVGAMTARITGYNETMDMLVAKRVVEPGKALVARFALGALARVPEGGGPPEIKVSLSIQDGWFYVGPVKLLPVVPLQWN